MMSSPRYDLALMAASMLPGRARFSMDGGPILCREKYSDRYSGRRWRCSMNSDPSRRARRSFQMRIECSDPDAMLAQRLHARMGIEKGVQVSGAESDGAPTVQGEREPCAVCGRQRERSRNA